MPSSRGEGASLLFLLLPHSPYVILHSSFVFSSPPSGLPTLLAYSLLILKYLPLFLSVGLTHLNHPLPTYLPTCQPPSHLPSLPRSLPPPFLLLPPPSLPLTFSHSLPYYPLFPPAMVCILILFPHRDLQHLPRSPREAVLRPLRDIGNGLYYGIVGIVKVSSYSVRTLDDIRAFPSNENG